jgi:hypothetical protein
MSSEFDGEARGQEHYELFAREATLPLLSIRLWSEWKTYKIEAKGKLLAGREAMPIASAGPSATSCHLDMTL